MHFKKKEWDSIKAAASFLGVRPESFVKLATSVMLDVLVKDPLAFKAACLFDAVGEQSPRRHSSPSQATTTRPRPKPHKETLTHSLADKLRDAGLAVDTGEKISGGA